MKASLFTKILLWFIATTFVSSLGVVIVSRLTMPEQRRMGGLPSRLAVFYAEEARRAYESGGRPALADLLERIKRTTGMEAFFADANGRDLVTGEDRSEVLSRPVRRRPAPDRGRVVVAHDAERGGYTIGLYLPPRSSEDFPLTPQHLWVGGSILLLSYALARHLTTPLRDLEKAVEQFGKGDFKARVRPARTDELGRLGQTFDRMAEYIETLVGAERQLLLDISHELRSPLTRLGVAVELARSGEDMEAALDRIQREADRLNALVGGLLQVTRAEGNPAAMRRQPVRLESLVSEVAAACELDARAAGCELELAVGNAATVDGDPELLRRAVENVLRNAIRFSPQGATVNVAVHGAIVSIRDFGPGASEQVLPNLFEGKYTGRPDGFGLGLAIARRAVELHHGIIRAENASPGLRVAIDLTGPGPR